MKNHISLGLLLERSSVLLSDGLAAAKQAAVILVIKANLQNIKNYGKIRNVQTEKEQMIWKNCFGNFWKDIKGIFLAFDSVKLDATTNALQLQARGYAVLQHGGLHVDEEKASR